MQAPAILDGNRPIQLSVENQRANILWGDELLLKPQHITRLYALNLNGLSLDWRGGQFDELCKVAKEVQVDMIWCQEPNVDALEPMVRTIMYQTAWQHWPRARLSVGSTPIPFVMMYKPGGNLVLSTGSVAGRLISTEADRWGSMGKSNIQGTSKPKNHHHLRISSESSRGLCERSGILSCGTAKKLVVASMGSDRRPPERIRS